MENIVTLINELELAANPYNMGLTFMNDRDILLTRDKWTLAVNIPLDDYINQIKGMRL
jgi:hypothetical protein